MTAITLTSKGQATIPKQIRDLLGVKPSGRITFEVRDGEVILRALGNPAGMLSAYARARPGRGVAASIGRHLARRDVRSHAD
ncbi:MAG: prlF antitoxin for toxin YhaV toxin [Verrucomicrobiota bacterium]|jgi:antitoxin PrlF